MKIVFNLFFCYYLISFLRETLPLLFLCFFERLVFFSTAFELCILIILHENKTQRVNQRTDRTETDIDRMTDQQDQQHTNRTQDNIHPFCHIDGLIKVMNEALSDGESIHLGEFGSFRMVAGSKGSATVDGFNTALFNRAHIVFYPGTMLINLVNNVSFERYVPKKDASSESAGGGGGADDRPGEL